MRHLIIVIRYIIKFNKYILMIMNRYICYNNTTMCQIIINLFKFQKFKFFILNKQWFNFLCLNRFISNQVTRFGLYMLQNYIFNEPIWFQLVNGNKDQVRIKLINGDKYNNIIGEIILESIWPEPSSLEFKSMFRNNPQKP